jgi:hypothetical protein
MVLLHSLLYANFSLYTVPISISGLKVPSQATRHTMIIATENSRAILRRKALTAPVYSPLWIDRAKSGLK